MSPGVGWLFAMAGRGATKDLFTDLFASYLEHCNNTMVLRHILEVRSLPLALWSSVCSRCVCIVCLAPPLAVCVSLCLYERVYCVTCHERVAGV